jgi:hypothetical protein
MSRMDLEQVVRDTNRRLDRVEQILPALPTREELDGKIAKLATREELRAAIEALGQHLDTRITEESERSRRETRVLFESLKDDIRIVAEGVASVQTTIDQAIRPLLLNHERRITTLEDRHRSCHTPR